MPVPAGDLVTPRHRGIWRYRIVESLGGAAAERAAPFPPPLLGNRARQRSLFREERENRPDPRRSAPRVTAAQREEDAARRELIGEREEAPEQKLVVTRRQHQVGERVFEVRVRSRLDDENAGPETAERHRHDRIENFKVALP